MTELTVPKHLGLILDGNRRWAKTQGLPTLEGHRKGYENLKTISLAAFERGVSFVSAYVFSTENWSRSKEEVDYLMKLLIWVAKNELKELHKKNIRIRFIGNRERLSASVIKAADAAEAKTEGNTGGDLLLCLNYGGHQEIVDAVNKILDLRKTSTSPDSVRMDKTSFSSVDVSMDTSPSEKESLISPETEPDRHGSLRRSSTIITQKVTKPLSVSEFADQLYAPDVPPVDLIVRTSGEQRLSNFMLWRAAYSELLFVDKHWPDFSPADLDEALEDYANRQRRFGK